MSTIVTRASKGSALSWAEGDANIVNLNTDKIELTDLSVGTPGAASGSGSIAYNNTTGVITYTPPDLSGYLTSYTETDPVVGAVTGIVKANGAGTISAAQEGTDYIASLVSDTSPQLGGDLDANGNTITDLKYRETVYELLNQSGTVTIDAANGNLQYVEIAGNITINGLANASAGDTVTILLDNLGAYTLTSSMLFAGGVNTITDSGLDVLSIFTPDGTTFLASLAQDFQ
jgi:hypothetical protein